jgi:hypothetical protein
MDAFVSYIKELEDRIVALEKGQHIHKRPRGRPPKPVDTTIPKRPRGRPKKNIQPL